MNTQPDMACDVMMAGDDAQPYLVKAAWIQSSNPLACTCQSPSSRIAVGLENMEFVVGVDLVWVSNVLGKIKQRAKITEEVPEWLVHCDHAWRSPEVKDPERNFDVYASNANELIPAQYGLTGFCVNLKSLSSDLTAAGKLPSCVHHCQVHVMKYGPISELAAELVAKPKQALFAVQ